MSARGQHNGELDALWQAWHERRERAARDALIRHYLPLVEFLANRAARGVPPSFRPDLVGFGVIGLMDALEKFQPERGLRFETYGSRRIRGAMADGIRSLQWLPRGAATRASRVIEQVVPVDFHTALTPVGAPLRDALPEDEESVLERLEREADHAEVARAVGELPERERAVIERYYYQRRSLADIGAELGVTESRVCQVHRAALRLLEDLLAATPA